MKISPQLESLMTQIESNKQQWTTLFEVYEAKMKKGNEHFTQEIEERKLPGYKVGWQKRSK